MKEQLAALWGKVVDNKETFIRVGCALAGAAVGSLITTAVINQQSMTEYDLLTELAADATAEQ